FDGDIDIMSYSNVGGAITLWKNFQVELNLPPDSLRYYLVDLCWGYFTDADCNMYFLNDCSDTFLRNYSHKRHTNGSSITLFDANNDKTIDFLIGNEGCRHMTMLYNATSSNSRGQDSFYMYDTAFVDMQNSAEVNIYPAAYLIDVTNDGNRDLVYAPNSTCFEFHIENINQIFWYNNIGTDSFPQWAQKEAFLTPEMIDIGRQNSWVFHDWDGDGDQDAIAATKGNAYFSKDTADRIHFFENIGDSKNPMFQLKSEDFGGLRKEKIIDLTIALGDLDSDGKMDLVCGNDRGEILYYRNTSSSSTTLNPTFIYSNPQFTGINIDIGNYSAPAVADINGDGLLDLVIGRYDSMLSYYRNNGTPENPVFVISTARFGQIKAFDSVGYQNIYDDTFAIIGYYPVYEKATYSKPVIMDIDGDDTLEILVVNSLGTIRMYEINADQVSGEFKQIDSFYHFPAFQLRKFYTPDMGN